MEQTMMDQTTFSLGTTMRSMNSSGRLTAGTTMSRAEQPFGLHDDERKHHKRATRDAVVRLTRLNTAELEKIAAGEGHHEGAFLAAQSDNATHDELDRMLGADRHRASGGRRHGRHTKKPELLLGATQHAANRPLSGVSRPGTTQLSGRPATPPTPLGHPLGHPLGDGPPPRAADGTYREYAATGDYGSGLGMDSLTYHSGSASTLPSKARALLDRHSFYSPGLRSHDNQRPRDHSVLGEYRSTRQLLGHEPRDSDRHHRLRTRLPSRGKDQPFVDPVEGATDRSGELDRVHKAKQLIKLAVDRAGNKSKAQLVRSFRLADQDRSGELEFDELNFSLRNDFKINGLTEGDMRRIFDAFDSDRSGRVSQEEFLALIEATPFPVLKHQVGFTTSPTPQVLKKRHSFDAWPHKFNLGTLRAGRDTKSIQVAIRNIGYSELRFRVTVRQLAAGQEAKVSDQPRGLVAPGLRSKLVVNFSCEKPGPIAAVVTIESADHCVDVHVKGSADDGALEFDAIHNRSATAPGSAPLHSPIGSKVSGSLVSWSDTHYRGDTRAATAPASASTLGPRDLSTPKAIIEALESGEWP